MANRALSVRKASESIEELLQQTEQPQPNWLITYLDVFVLIIMLIVTLISLSDIKTETKLEKKFILQRNSQSSPLAVKKLSLIPSKVIPTEKIQEIRGVTKKELLSPPPILLAPQIPPPLPNNTNKKTPPPTPLSKDKSAAQLNQTIEELGLLDSVSIKISKGYAQLEIQDKILFKSSEANLLTEGAGLLNKITHLLDHSTGLIYIEGHTDNRPIKTIKFPSNWELGAARATSVLHYLASQNIDVTRLRAITYGATKPRADNSTDEGRERNRRVSLVLKIQNKAE